MTPEAIIAPDGTVRFVYTDDLIGVAHALGDVTIKRASHVEPDEDGGWTADMSPVGGPTLTGFAKRADALAAEVRWLNNNSIPLPR